MQILYITVNLEWTFLGGRLYRTLGWRGFEKLPVPQLLFPGRGDTG